MQKLYQDIFIISKEIGLQISLGDFDGIEKLLQKREELLQKTSKNDKKTNEIAEIIEKIKAQDEDNIARLQECKKSLGRDLRSLSKNMKVVSLYKISDTTSPNLIDERN